MKRGRCSIGTAIALTLLLTLGLSVGGLQTAAAGRVEHVGVVGITVTMDQSLVAELPSGKLAVVTTIVGAGTIDCLENRSCVRAGLDGQPAPISSVMYAVFNPATGRTTGRILIDVIGAGFTGSVRGNTTSVGPQEWDVDLAIRARSRAGHSVAIQLGGALVVGAPATVGPEDQVVDPGALGLTTDWIDRRFEGRSARVVALIGELTGQGIITTERMGEI